jgi:hypothetical protein
MISSGENTFTIPEASHQTFSRLTPHAGGFWVALHLENVPNAQYFMILLQRVPNGDQGKSSVSAPLTRLPSLRLPITKRSSLDFSFEAGISVTPKHLRFHPASIDDSPV